MHIFSSYTKIISACMMWLDLDHSCGNYAYVFSERQPFFTAIPFKRPISQKKKKRKKERPIQSSNGLPNYNSFELHFPLCPLFSSRKTVHGGWFCTPLFFHYLSTEMYLALGVLLRRFTRQPFKKLSILRKFQLEIEFDHCEISRFFLWNTHTSTVRVAPAKE